MRPDAVCTCRTWSLADSDIAEDAALVRRQKQEAEEYRLIVAQWNALVEKSGTDRQRDFFGYCAFLLATYDALQAREMAAEPVG